MLFLFSYSSSSFFFFPSQLDQLSITCTTSIKTHKHHWSPLTHKHLSTPPTSIHITDPHAAMAMAMKSPLQSPIHDPPIHDHQSMIHKQWSTIKAPIHNPQALFQSSHTHKFTKMLSLSLLVCLCVSVFDFLLILWCDRCRGQFCV